MDDAAAVRGAPAAPGPTALAPLALRSPLLLAALHHSTYPPIENPFMNKMDEISYWISTKQAPCLFNYDNVIKRQCEEAHCSKLKSVQSIILEVQSPKKKKKRKLSLLDDESTASEKHQNVFFDTSQSRNNQTMLGCESDSSGSDLDFNVKRSSIQNKVKKAKLKKTNRATLHKKNKIVTSTPNVSSTLRRSMRRMQGNNRNDSALNNSFEALNGELVNGSDANCNNITCKKQLLKEKKGAELFAAGDQSSLRLSRKKGPVVGQANPLNGLFDDISDVSGFTANYIRSTKINTSKKLRNVRSKGNRHCVKVPEQNTGKREKTTVMCVNKSINTGQTTTPILNCSTDSSQNMINLVTLQDNETSKRVSRGTSVLKFIGVKNNKKSSMSCNQTEETGACNVNVSFQSKSSAASRYPKRHVNSSAEEVSPVKYEEKSPLSKVLLNKRRKSSRNAELHSDRKENPEEVSRTRSGRCIGLSIRQSENSVLVLSNSAEPVSPFPSMNVASPMNTNNVSSRTKKRNTKKTEIIKKKDRSGLLREAVRDKSGFAACFSDTDDDNEHVKEKKFFC